MRLFLVSISLSFISHNGIAQDDLNIWTLLQNIELEIKESNLKQEMPLHFQALKLNAEELEHVLEQSPLRFSADAKERNVEMDLPLPNGQYERFRIFNFPVLQPKLAEKYPDLKTFTAVGIKHAHLTAKIEMTPLGFSSMILGDTFGPIFIKPFSKEKNWYYSFYKKDYPNNEEPFYCEVEEFIAEETESSARNNPTFVGDCQLRQYRMALACTGEFAQLIDDEDDSNGDIVADVLADMVIVMNRVNGIFEKEVGVTMVIIDRNEEIIFTDPDNDLYSNNIVSLPAENRTVLNITIGNDAFDIGHVFSSVGGGRAFTEGPCNGPKAAGASGRRSSPTPEGFALDIVAHEIGHQFGARHTFNTTTAICAESATASYEPGSGSTIMSYARVCPPLVQTFVDPYFHAISIQQIGDFITTDGNVCPVILNSENNAPSADAGSDFIIPVSTPYLLRGNGSDIDNDIL